jgi:chromosomal replication initiation ATPase DnaA
MKPTRDGLYVASKGFRWAFYSNEHAKTIVARTAADHGVRVEDIMGVRKPRKIVAARFDAWKRVAEAIPQWSYIQLGRFFDRDHTTIHKAVVGAGFRRRDARLARREAA